MWPNFQSGTTLRTRNFPSGWSTWWLSPAAGLFRVHLNMGICEFARAASCPPSSFMHEQYRIVIVVSFLAFRSRPSLLSPLPGLWGRCGWQFQGDIRCDNGTSATYTCTRIFSPLQINLASSSCTCKQRSNPIDCFSSLIYCCCLSFVLFFVLDL